MKKTNLVVLALCLSGVIGLQSQVVSAAEDEARYNSYGAIQFIPNTDPTLPVDPEDPDPTNPVEPIDPTDPNGPNPGTSGPLSLDYASSLHFGLNKISIKDETYYANAQEFKGTIAGEYRGNYVQVTDNRGTLEGWTLRVSQGGQFTSEAAKQYKVLNGAALEFTQGVPDSISRDEVISPTTYNFVLDPFGASSIVMTAAAGTGSGTWVDYFGSAEEMTIEGKRVQKNQAVRLSVPGATPKEAVEYRTVLTWSLTDTPSI